MLSSLRVQGFRCFRDLTVERLGRVTLITGRNNVGKTCLLEAVRLYVDGGAATTFWEILHDRDQLPQELPAQFNLDQAIAVEQGCLSLFTWDGEDDDEQRFSIGPVDCKEPLAVSLGWLENGAPPAGGVLPRNVREAAGSGLERALEINRDGRRKSFLSLAHMARVGPRRWREEEAAGEPTGAGYVRSLGLDRQTVSLLWDRVALTPEEQTVVAALGIVQPGVDDAAVLGAGAAGMASVPFVRFEAAPTRVALRVLGEGMTRLFGLVLALVNCRHGWLLVDEIENGLHHSVFPEMWQLIFETAERLDIQVLAGTHSLDCTQAFAELVSAKEQAAEESEEPSDEAPDGVLVRLDNRGGDVRAFTYERNDLEKIARQGIEVR